MSSRKGQNKQPTEVSVVYVKLVHCINGTRLFRTQVNIKRKNSHVGTVFVSRKAEEARMDLISQRASV